MKNTHVKIFYTLFFFVFFLTILRGEPDPTYDDSRWQMRVRYEMDIHLDSKSHQFEGRQKLTLFNNSPDTLTKVFYHLYWNAFQPGSDMDERSRWIIDPDPRIKGRILELKEEEMGFIQVNQLKSNGNKVKWTVQGTILEVQLSHPLDPADSVELDMKFLAQVPIMVRRAGRNNKEGIDYSMSQWYPKLCNYDAQGWHTNPYIGREFYGIWGDYKVSIKLESRYTVAATGVLMNPEENEQSTKDLKESSWMFQATNVHDFVWAADPDYQKIKHTTKTGLNILCYFQPDPRYDEAWSTLPLIIEEALKFIELKYGPYPYPSYSFIQAGDGGMEYPMATLITGHRSLGSLVGVSLHELMHSWFQMVLATNESLYPWMDEGFASYAEEEVMNHLIVKGLLPDAKPSDNLHHKNALAFINFAKNGMEEALCTHSDHYSTNTAYGVGSYSKGELCLKLLHYMVGEDAFDQAMLNYYWKWRFKHPTPDDFFRIMEKASGLELDWFHQYFIHTTKNMDYGVDTLFSADKNHTVIRLARVELFPMPVEVKVIYINGQTEEFCIPIDLMRGNCPFDKKTKKISLPYWPWVRTTYEIKLESPLDKIKEIIVDPDENLLDINLKNNIWTSIKQNN